MRLQPTGQARHVRWEFRMEDGDEEKYGGDLGSEEHIRTFLSN